MTKLQRLSKFQKPPLDKAGGGSWRDVHRGRLNRKIWVFYFNELLI
jgi:hypothetical protein